MHVDSGREAVLPRPLHDVVVGAEIRRRDVREPESPLAVHAAEHGGGEVRLNTEKPLVFNWQPIFIKQDAHFLHKHLGERPLVNEFLNKGAGNRVPADAVLKLPRCHRIVDARGKVLRKVYGARDWDSRESRALLARTLGVSLD